MSKYLKAMFDHLKGMGMFTEYKDFDDYNKRKFGVYTEKEKEVSFEERAKQNHKEFYEGLSEKDKEDYDAIFGG